MPDPDPGVAAGLYIHIPFCSSVCPYCDFAVRTGGPLLRREFVDSLLLEIEMRRGHQGAFDTIYLGGGTPSVLETEQLSQILGGVRAALNVDQNAGIFLEANPENVAVENLETWHRLGVSFLSLGVQSFNQQALQFLGRNHSAKQARAAVELAKKSGIGTISIDLIYGLPGQSVESWQQDLQSAVDLEPDHISCYQLTVHNKTVFGDRRSRGLLIELGDEAQGEHFEMTHAFLRYWGYPGYEVSSFAKNTLHQSRHNRKYWDHTPYIGFGPSAHSFCNRRRWWNVRSLKLYQQRLSEGLLPIEDGEDLTVVDLRFEAVMLGLRTSEGINLRKFQSRWGLDLEFQNRELIDQLVQQGRLFARNGRLIPSETGWAVADRLALQFDIGNESAS